MTPNQMQETLSQALQDQAPQVFQRWKNARILLPTINRIVAQQMDGIAQVTAKLIEGVEMTPEQQAHLAMGIKMHEEIALDEAIQDLLAMAMSEDLERTREAKIKNLTFEQINAMSLSEVEALGFEDVMERLHEIQGAPAR